MDIGNKIKNLRNKRNLTQKQLATKLNISASTIGMYEQNRREPDNKTLVKLSQFFYVSTDYLLNNLPQNTPETLPLNAEQPLLNEFESNDDEYITDHENKLIDAYRAKPELQLAVDIILGIADNNEEQ